MKDFDLAKKELQKFKKRHDLVYEYNGKKWKWNKEFYPITDDDGRFIKWKLGKWNRPSCMWCGKILYKLQKDPKSRATRYCSTLHGKLHRKVISEAMEKFNLKYFDLLKNNTKKYKNWFVLTSSIYEYSKDKLGNLHERNIKQRVERKDIQVVINGKRYPFTKKSRTV